MKGRCEKRMGTENMESRSKIENEKVNIASQCTNRVTAACF